MPCDRVLDPKVLDADKKQLEGCPYVPSPWLFRLRSQNYFVLELWSDVQRFGWEGAQALHSLAMTQEEQTSLRSRLRVIADFHAEVQRDELERMRQRRG